MTKALLDRERKRATAVLYVDGEGREVEQPAEIVILCAFGLNNVNLLLNSGIGQPYDPATGQATVGRNYTYQTMASVSVFYPESVRINPFESRSLSAAVLSGEVRTPSRSDSESPSLLKSTRMDVEALDPKAPDRLTSTTVALAGPGPSGGERSDRPSALWGANRVVLQGNNRRAGPQGREGIGHGRPK